MDGRSSTERLDIVPLSAAGTGGGFEAEEGGEEDSVTVSCFVEEEATIFVGGFLLGDGEVVPIL